MQGKDIEELIQGLECPRLAVLIEEELKDSVDPRVKQRLHSQFLAGELRHLEWIIVQKEAEELLHDFLLRWPEQRIELLRQLQQSPIVWKDTTGYWQLWIRRLFYSN